MTTWTLNDSLAVVAEFAGGVRSYFWAHRPDDAMRQVKRHIARKGQPVRVFAFDTAGVINADADWKTVSPETLPADNCIILA